MFAFATLMSFCLLFAWGFARRRAEPARARSDRLFTFLVDPPTMFLVGLLSVLAGLATRKGRRLSSAEYRKRRRTIDVLQHVFLLAFWAFELSSYFDLMRHPFDPSRSGNDFMMNGYIEWLTGPIYRGPFPTYHHWWSWPLLAAMLLLQWGALRFGRALGHRAARVDDADEGSGPTR